MKPSPIAFGRLGSIGLLTLCACVTTPPESDPTAREVPVEALSGWNARLAYDGQGLEVLGIQAREVFPQYAAPELVALDERGRCHVLVADGSRCVPLTVALDGSALRCLTQGDFDGQVAGDELYAGSERGRIYQIVGDREGQLVTRTVADLDGRKVSALLAADAIPWEPGVELLVFSDPGGLWLVSEVEGKSEARLVQDLDGAVLGACLLPAREDQPPEIVTASRDGRLEIVQWTDAGPIWRSVHRLPAGMGPLACATVLADEWGEATVIYNACDDGTLWRHVAGQGGDWTHEMIYAGPRGPRGIALGRFVEQGGESLAVFGDSGRVELLTRQGDDWAVETLFESAGLGRGIAAGELDGRNRTDELALAGDGTRVVVLSRPPGYGLSVLSGAQ
jgi:hypothetical protein